MNSSFAILSLFPPILVLVLGYITRRIILSLSAGIALAAFIASNFALVDTFKLVSQCLWVNFELNKFFTLNHFWETWNLFICVFLLILGIFVTLLQCSGGAYAYGTFAKKFIRNRKTAETSSLILSSSLFIDDYFSSLTVGSVMYPLTDQQRIPRVKLAFLVDSMSAPMAILCPFSSWVAAILGFLRENGINSTINASTLIHAAPLSVYFYIIPFIFYSFILIICTWFIVHFRISFGLMRKYEQQTQNLSISEEPSIPRNNPHNTTLVDFFAPVFFLLICILAGMLFSGHWQGFGGENDFINAMQNSSAAIALFLGGNAALILCTLFFIIRKRISLQDLPAIYLEGIKLMLPAVIVLMLAWSLGDILRNNLNTGEYLANIMLNSVDINFLPALLFTASALIAFTIGSSWGTAAMIFPIAIPMTLSLLEMGNTIPTISQIPILFPILGAVLSGCVAGDHMSPISDTTIMSATSTKTPLMDHVQTQLPYAIPVLIATAIAFYFSTVLLPYGSVIACLGSMSIGLICAIGILLFRHRMATK